MSAITRVPLHELVRLAFPPGTPLPAAAFRERPVAWVVIAGAGMVPDAGDLVLCGERVPSPGEMAAWQQKGIAGIVLMAGLSAPAQAGLPVVVLPAEVSMRELEQAALQMIVNRQSYLMERGTRVYASLARCAVEGGGLDLMAQTMRDLTGKSIVVQDKRLKPLAQSVSPGLGRLWDELLPVLGEPSQLPEDMRDRRQAVAGGWSDQALPGEWMRRVCPIVAKGMARGYLSIVGPANEFDVLDQLVVEHGAAACALEMAKAKAVSDAEKRARGDLTDAVLTGALPPDELARWAQRIGYDVEPPHVAMVWRWGPPEPGQSAPSLRRLETIVNQSVVQQGVSALVRPRETEIIVLCAVSNAFRPDVALSLAAMIRAAARDEYPQQPLRAGLGRPAAELADWKDSYREALQALAMAERLDESDPLYFGNLSVYRLLFQLEGNAELQAFCRQTLGPLLDYEGGGDLLETLEAFVDRLGNLSQTAEKLFIHRNSLLYRMERIAQLTGLDLNNPDTRLAVHLALKVRKMLQPDKRPRAKP